MPGIERMRRIILVIFCLSCCFSGPLAWAGGTNSVFLRMDNMVNELERNHSLSAEAAQEWRATIQTLRNKVDERILRNGGGMNPIQDQDLFSEIDTEGKKLFNMYQQEKSQSRQWN